MTMPKPSPELAKFEPLIGNWEGVGTATMAPGAPPTNWTSRGTAKWIMNGFFVQEDVRIKFEGENVPPPMCWRTYYGWDSNKRKLVAFSASNEGKIESSQLLSWVGNTKINAELLETPIGPAINRRLKRILDLPKSMAPGLW